MWEYAECAYGAGGGCGVISEKGWGWYLWGNVGAVCGVSGVMWGRCVGLCKEMGVG